MNSKPDKCRNRIRQVHGFLPAIFSFLFFSCVNQISDDSIETLEPGNVPISLNFTVNDIQTRVANNSFQEGDEIGLFVSANGVELSKSRYIDNVKMSYSGSKFVPENSIYYPEIECSCSFYGYYPYNPKGMNTNTSCIDVEVSANQGDLIAYSSSDFLFAVAKNITDRSGDIDLLFSHKCYKLKIKVKAESDSSLDLICESNPTITIKSVYTKGTFDLDRETFTNRSTTADVIPYGVWEKQGDCLEGKTAFLIPQELTAGSTLFELDVNGTIYDCKVPKNYSFKSGVSETITLTIDTTESTLKIDMETEIDDWDPGNDNLNIEGSARNSVISLSALDDMAACRIWKVMSSTKQVAEICRECIFIGGTARSAYVIYPYDDKADLENGLVAQIEGMSGNVHGGKVSWKSDGTYTYISGTQERIEYLYVNSEGEILTQREDDAIQVEVLPYRLEDVRGGTSIFYPITKIGTQYWIYNNLKSAYYSDGSKILNIESNDDFSYGLYRFANNQYYYNKVAASISNLIPEGWALPNKNDFQNLMTFVGDNIDLLKRHTSWNTGLTGTNLTGFNAVGAGYYSGTDDSVKEYLETAKYWVHNEDKSSFEMATLDANGITIATPDVNTLASIRIIRE